MQWTRVQRRLSVWMAVFAVLLMSVAPTLSHVLHREATPGWVELCSVQGSRWIKVDDGAAGETPDPRPTQAHVFEHCPYCSVQAQPFGPPPSPTVVALVPVFFELPRLFFAAPRTLHAWLAAQPRAPPPLS